MQRGVMASVPQAAPRPTRLEPLSAPDKWVRWLAFRLVELDRYPKRAILAANDFILFNFALWLAMCLRLGELFVPPSAAVFGLLTAAPLIGVATCFQLGVYRMVTRFIGTRGFTLAAGAVGLSALYWSLLLYLSGVYSIPRSVIILYPVLATVLIWLSRQSAMTLLRRGGVEIPSHVAGQERPVLIYGAGASGVQLLEALQASGGYRVVGFVDPRRTLARQYVAGLWGSSGERLAAVLGMH